MVRESTPHGELQLQRRGDRVFEIIYNGVFLMASYNEPSARALAELALALLPATRANLRILVGGLGMGYTLASTLDDPRVDRVDVVEIERLVIDWNRQYLSVLAGAPLEEPRTHLYETDLVTFLSDTHEAYDALLLDVDNGPGWLAIDSNHRLYGWAGLECLKARLAAGGVLGIWSADTSPDFLKRLTTVFGHASAERVIDHTPEGREIEATIYLAHG